MDTTNFTDIFKSSFIEKTSAFSLTDALIGLLASFIIGLFIYAVYKKTFSGVIYSHTFNISLMIMTMALKKLIIASSSESSVLVFAFKPV